MILPVQRIVQHPYRRRRHPPLRHCPRRSRARRDRGRVPPRRALGDLAVPLAFELARRLRKAPRAIAQEIGGRARPDRRDLADRSGAERLHQLLPRSRAPSRSRWLRRPHGARRRTGDKTIVEHTAINPNKAAHIGHLRNAALGDAFGRLLRFLGRQVEIQNYIDDTGVQVADVAVGFRELEAQGPRRTSARSPTTTRFDYYCWDLYARVTEWYDGDKDRLKIRIRGAARHRARRQPTAGHRRSSSPIASSAATSKRWRG